MCACHGEFGERCYFDNELCAGELWECQTCGEQFCQTHWHETAKGHNVECAGCAYSEDDYARDFPSGTEEE